jgi:hypothetical protein
VLRSGFYALSDDDFARVVIAQRFAHSPSLDPSGTSWLPFPFWLTGGFMWVTDRALFIARFVALASNVVGLLLVHRAALLLGATRLGAVLGACLSAVLPTAAKLGVSFQPEALTAGLVVFAAATTQVDGRWRLAGGLALVAAPLSRYEAWPAAAAFAGFCLWDALRGRGDRRSAAAAGLALVGPLAWLLHGVVRHGDALFFLRRVSAYRRALGEHESPLHALLAYPIAALRAEPELCLLAIGVAVFWLRGARQSSGHAPRRFAVVLGALCVFLLSGRLLDGAPTHHDERTLLPVFWGGAIFVGDALAHAASFVRASARTRATAVAVALVLVGTGLLVRRAFPGDADAPRSDERALGDSARKMSPGAFLVVDTPDYGYFAVIAAFGSPERAAPLIRHDPRDPANAALPSPEAVATALRGACPAPSASCAYVVHEAHRDAASALGTVALTHRAFALIRGRDP